MVMEDMQAVYDDETNNGGFGLMSLLRAPTDIGLDPSIMDNLPMLLKAFEGTNKGTLTMKELSEMSSPVDESSFSFELSQSPGVMSLLEEYGVPYASEIATGASLAGGIGGKLRATGDGFDDIIERIKKLAQENRDLQGQQDMDLTRQKNDPDLPDLYKDFGTIQKQNRSRDSFSDQDIDRQNARDQEIDDIINDTEPQIFREQRELMENRPSRSMTRDPNLNKGLASLEDSPAPLQDSKDYFDRMTRDGFNIDEKTINKNRYISREDRFAALSEREQMVINAKRDQHRKTFKELFGPDKDRMTFETEQKLLEKLERLEKELDPFFPPTEFMASGGRPGLYANINAKRKRIAAGSGERMRKKGEKGAPTAANFRESAKTAKKANGGGLSYMNGYYGKSYK
tara:strand:- start:483 stop:1682 length:1200 start_codon:yes stop_codon:yes gene_type:complete